MATDLLQYIDQQLRAGYSLEQVKTYLVQSGYAPHMIDQAVQTLHTQYSSSYYPPAPEVQQTPQATAEIYVEQLRKMGYDEQQIEQYLQSIGMQMPKKSLDLHADIQSFQGMLARFHLSLSTFIIICVGIFCIIAMATAIVLISSGSEGTKMRDETLEETQDTDPEVDEDQNDTGNDFWDDAGQEALPGSTDGQSTDAPQNHSGVSDAVGEEDPGDTDDDNVFTQPSADPSGSDLWETGNDHQEDDDQQQVSQGDPTQEYLRQEQESVQSFETQLLEIAQLAATDKKNAKQRCEQFEEKVYQDECFYQITRKTDNIAFCSYISDDQRHDRCLMNQAMKTNDFSGCSQYRTALRETCEELVGA
ncbi:MAG: hypothetical protein ACOCWQ_05480 [Nanoarchaeota archaeon]